MVNMQGLQETSEDLMFNVGSYLAASRAFNSANGPRWHFLISAPISASNRAWHTAAELLSWSPPIEGDSSQYDHLTKQFVMGKAEKELRRYANKNFVHFIQRGEPADPSWKMTERQQKSRIGGLPTKLFDQTPLSGNMYYSHHHSNISVAKVHEMLVGKPRITDQDMDACARVTKGQQKVEDL